MGVRALAVAIAAAVVLAVPAAGAAPVDGVRIARDGTKLLVAGPPAGVGVTVDAGARPGTVAVRVALPATIAEAPEDCAPSGLNEVSCPVWRSTVVVVRLGEGGDWLTLGAAAVPFDAATRGGDDQIEAGGSLAHDRIDAGPGDDLVSWGGRWQEGGVSVRPRGVPGGEDQVAGAETLETTPGDDDVRTGREVRHVTALQGADRVDLRDGRANGVDCGDDPGDLALLDAGDDPRRCARVVRTAASAVPKPPAPPAAPPTPARAAHADLVATPRYDAGTVHLVLRALPGTEAAVSFAAAPWGAPDQLHALEQRTAPAGPDGLARAALVLPPPAREALEVDGRLRLRGELRVGDAGPRPVSFTVFTWRRPRVAALLRVRRGSFGPQRLLGTRGGDLISGASGGDVIDGRAGDDRLLGGTGNDRVHGALGDDAIDGGDGDDRLLGGPGADDVVEQRFGDDVLDGGDGDDVLHGARGGDALRGGAGDDVLTGGSGSDRLDCGPGHDVAFVNFAAEEARVVDCEEVYDEPGVIHLPCTGPGTGGGETMLGSEAADTCTGLAGDDDLEGRGDDDVLDAGDGDDRLFGRFGADRLLGGAGGDELEGGRGEDLLDGGDGDDVLNGGIDRDVVTGGPGADTLIARGGEADQLDCGPGRDVAYVDSRDWVTGCERVHRSRGRG